MKHLSYAMALSKSQRFCSYQERCVYEIRLKLKDWGIGEQDASKIVLELIKENYLNDERFARIYTSGKFRIKRWGKIKISRELSKRQIDDSFIRSAINEIDQDEYLKLLEELLRKKSKEIKTDDTFIFNNKLAAYAVSHGYETDLVWKTINAI
jgi:Uncharacterized protein conserved in bacteria